jgi:hypothetical protein
MHGSRYDVGCVVTRRRAERSGVRFTAGARVLHLQKRPDRLWGPPGLQSRLAFYTGGKAAGSWIRRLVSTSARVKNECNCICVLHMCLHDVGRHNLTVLSFPSSVLQLFRATLTPACALKFPGNLVPSITIVSRMLEMSWPCNILRTYNPYFRYTCCFYSILNVWLRIWNPSSMV